MGILPLPASPKYRGGEGSQKIWGTLIFLPLNLGGDVDEGDRGGTAFLPLPASPKNRGGEGSQKTWVTRELSPPKLRGRCRRRRRRG